MFCNRCGQYEDTQNEIAKFASGGSLTLIYDFGNKERTTTALRKYYLCKSCGDKFTIVVDNIVDLITTITHTLTMHAGVGSEEFKYQMQLVKESMVLLLERGHTSINVMDGQVVTRDSMSEEKIDEMLPRHAELRTLLHELQVNGRANVDAVYDILDEFGGDRNETGDTLENMEDISQILDNDFPDASPRSEQTCNIQPGIPPIFEMSTFTPAIQETPLDDDDEMESYDEDEDW